MEWDRIGWSRVMDGGQYLTYEGFWLLITMYVERAIFTHPDSSLFILDSTLPTRTG
jgi:hypothetical protein